MPPERDHARDDAPGEADAQRIDKWLWHARFARTRAAAQDLVRSGHARVNRDKVRDAARRVRPGDVITLSLDGGVRVVRVLGIAARREGFPRARLLYEDAAPSPSDAAHAGGAGAGGNDVSREARPVVAGTLQPKR